jgi:hypothetical protein
LKVAQLQGNQVKSDKALAPPPGKMYRKVDSPPTPPEKFELPFEGKLSLDNRWVIMANLIPWDEFEEEYAKNFAGDTGAPALPFRMALGSLIIKEKLGISDRETVQQIKENPYLQYFIGQKYYSNDVGVSKRRFSLNRVMAKLPDTCQTAIAITFFSHESFHPAKAGFLLFFVLPTNLHLFFEPIINPGYDWRNCQQQRLIIN